jgi:putative ATP-dependent endonuclease of the OLD family
MSAIRLLYLTERREPVGRAEATQLLRYKVTRGGTETLKEIQQTINNLLGVQVDAFESPQTGNPERQAEMDVDNFLLEVNGSGIKEALRLVLDVEFKNRQFSSSKSRSTSALEINMMRYLRKKSETCQVFLSTHSTNFLDSFEMKMCISFQSQMPKQKYNS